MTLHYFNRDMSLGIAYLMHNDAFLYS